MEGGKEEKESKAWTRATGRVDPNGLSTANGGRDVGGAEGYFQINVRGDAARRDECTPGIRTARVWRKGKMRTNVTDTEEAQKTTVGEVKIRYCRLLFSK